MSRAKRPSNQQSSAVAPAKKNSKGAKPSQQPSSASSKPRLEKPAAPTLISLLATSIRNRTFLRLILSQPLSHSETGISKVSIRIIQIDDVTKYQWAVRKDNQETHKNLTSDELILEVKSTFGSSLGDAHLFTTEADTTVRWNYGKPQRIKQKPPTQQLKGEQEHNRQKQYLIPAGVPCPFLIEIGVMLPTGQVRPTMYHKFRQINRYLEFVEDVLPQLSQHGTLQIVDFGCGKSYLTFALHYLLTTIHHRQVQIIGLDLKADVIDDCSRIAAALKCEGLQFQIGRIEQFEPTGHVHLAVSLHACDTATDDALAAALRWNCDVILAVPCCQHEICQTIGKQTLPGLTGYGILKERFASLATDALRAQFLELHGYRTQVLEFIETEHTPKNLLIRAVRKSDGVGNDSTELRKSYDQLKEVLGIETWHLEQKVPESD